MAKMIKWISSCQNFTNSNKMIDNKNLDQVLWCNKCDRNFNILINEKNENVITKGYLKCDNCNDSHPISDDIILFNKKIKMKSVKYQVYNQASCPVSDRVRYQVWYRVRQQVKYQVWYPVSNQVSNQVIEQVIDQVR